MMYERGVSAFEPTVLSSCSPIVEPLQFTQTSVFSGRMFLYFGRYVFDYTAVSDSISLNRGSSCPNWDKYVN